LTSPPTAREGTVDIKLHTIPEVAERLGVTRGTVYQLMKDGELRTVKIGAGRGRLRVRSDDVTAFIHRLTTTTKG
jgi:excisionase family DNA binding protein